MASELTVGRLALAANVTAGTVRYYERLGLLPRASRTSSGYRVFTSESIRRLTVVRAAREFGFSLAEIAAFLRVRDGGGKPCEQVRDAGRHMLAKVESEIASLQVRRRRIRRTLRAWDRRLARAAGPARAYLLESL